MRSGMVLHDGVSYYLRVIPAISGERTRIARLPSGWQSMAYLILACKLLPQRIGTRIREAVVNRWYAELVS